MSPQIRIVFSAAFVFALIVGFGRDALAGNEEPPLNFEVEANNTIKALQFEQSKDVAALERALKEAGEDKARAALATAFGVRAAARAEKLSAVLERLNTMTPVAPVPPVEERIPAGAPDEVKAMLRERFTLLDGLEALEQSAKGMSSEQRRAAYQNWSQTSEARLETNQRALTQQNDLASPARLPVSAVPPPEGLSAAGKAAWTQRDQLQGELEALREQTKNFSPAARSQAYAEWNAANAEVMGQALRQLQVEAAQAVQVSDP
jgi:hypothetical protein